MKIAVIGGGAAGFFSALAAKQASPDSEVILFEKSGKVLSKVRVSGGGRCNVTHACFDPKILVQNYPRGKKELLGPFFTFGPKETIEWFEKRGVELKVEKDGRMFPITDSSETIINCLVTQAKKLGCKIVTLSKLVSIKKSVEEFELQLGDEKLIFDKVILATGSASAGFEMAKELGHEIQAPVPSLFTFNVPDFPLIDLAGIAAENVLLKFEGSPLEQTGPLLITHWGFSGPAALKLSAFAARFLAEKNYEATLVVDWFPGISIPELVKIFEGDSSKQVMGMKMGNLPKNLWKKLIGKAGIGEGVIVANLKKAAILALCQSLKADRYSVRGKTTHKEEFVTCGGVALNEVNFKTMESKVCKGLYFCGEILDIDGVTGGFNFQNAWTTGFIAGSSSVKIS